MTKDLTDLEKDQKTVPTTFIWSKGGDHVALAGSFDPPIPTWTPIEMQKISNDSHQVILNLSPNKKYFYKFVVDNQWVLDPNLESCLDEEGNKNHHISVQPLKPCLDENREHNVDPLKPPATVPFNGKERDMGSDVFSVEEFISTEHKEEIKPRWKNCSIN
ncbi:759_t:CDS:1 [Funneliformis mosseae]|uniref:759_t:CDS:1 n=1 Tax=Funneliformis mosseae TaxID=27381 RepID=A0A9N9A4L5_FUNMO|nr:759_t:CDS:1 [Funneliformis mosseae]